MAGVIRKFCRKSGDVEIDLLCFEEKLRIVQSFVSDVHFWSGETSTRSLRLYEQRQTLFEVFGLLGAQFLSPSAKITVIRSSLYELRFRWAFLLSAKEFTLDIPLIRRFLR